MPRKPLVVMSDGDFRNAVNSSANLRELMLKTGMKRAAAVRLYRAIDQQNGVKKGLIRVYTKRQEKVAVPA